MKTYYSLLDLKPKSTPIQIHATFRRFLARYRPTLTVEQIFADQRFLHYLNAYLTLTDPALRDQYDRSITRASQRHEPPRPYDDSTIEEQHMLLARVAFWRREMVEAIHQLRLVLEQDPDYAAAWALLGEIYFSVGRLDDGVHAYTRAVSADPQHVAYAERLQHARHAAEGKAELRIELSPEEELLREERRQRWIFMALITLLGAVAVAYAFFLPIEQAQLGFLDISWRSVIIQAVGIMLVMLGFSFGRLLPSFDQVMVWSTISSGDRGHVRQLPYGLLLLVLSVASLWIAMFGLIVTALMDDEWPSGPSIMLGICALVNIGFGFLLFHAHLPWGNALIFGGNGLVIAAMLGWFVGSLDAPKFEF